MYPYTVTDDRLGRNKKRKDNGKGSFFPDEIVLGNLVIMRFLFIYVQRRSQNKHLRFPVHVFHPVFIPSLVSKSYAPCF